MPARPAPSLLACAGREAELERLLELARAAESGSGSLVLLRGPAGIGKTRVLSELRGRVRLAGGVVLEGRAEPGRAFAPFVEIIERALRFLDEIGRVGTLDLGGLSCRSGCHRFWHQHAPGLTAQREAGPDVEATQDEGAPPEIAAFERRMRFFDSALAVLREVAKVRAPVVLVHNLERADRGTLELLHFLVEGVAPPFAAVVREGALPALFVASLRSDVAPSNPEALDALEKSPLARPIVLGALDVQGVRAYLQTDEAVARILARTGGNPDLIDLLLEADPLTPEVRVERRLGRITPQARALVQALAVLGRPASLTTLAAVAGVSADVAARADLGPDLLARSLFDGGVVLAFERDSDRDVTYALTPPRVRAEMHARAVDTCADALELEDAVRHAIATGDLERASGLALAAAASLAARHAHAEAALLLERLTTAMGEEAPLLIHEELADLYRIAGSYRAALGHAQRVRDARPDDPEASRRVGHLLTVAGELDGARTALELARGVAERAGRAEPLAEVEAQLAELSYQRGGYAEARRWAEAALERAREAGRLRIEIHARNTLGKLALAQKDPAAAAALFEENRTLASRSGLGHQEAQAWTNLGVALLLRRDLGRAEEACKKAVEVATRASDTRDRAIATENLAVIAHLGRDYRRALSSYHVAVGLLKRLGNRPMLARVAINLGELYLSLGDRSQARSLSELASHVLGSSPPAPREGERLLLRGRVDAADGRSDDARSAFERALQVFAQLGDARTADVVIELGRLAVTDGDVALARSLLSRLPVEETPKRAAEVALLRAEVERAAGGEALAASRRAVELADRVGDDEALLPALVGWARALLDAGDPQAAAHVLERARGVEHGLSRNVPDEALPSWSERRVRTELVTLSARLETSWAAGLAATHPLSGTLPGAGFKPIGGGTPPAGLARPDPRGARPQRERSERWARRYPAIVGRSAVIANVLGVLDKVAASDTTVLVRGESGTGKELVAEAIHENSARSSRPLVKVNCAALVESLLLSELFGHEKGAFTGAQARRKGRFELADGGTLFLDEIGDISQKTQVALLRVLQEREFERVGGTQPIRVDVRIVCATHRDLEKMVKEGSFREDLYYRLRGVTIEVPPLRKRPEDLPLLAERLLGRIAEERREPARRIAEDALELLARHRWPGNVRELENVLRSATLFAEGEVLARADFAAFETTFEPGGTPTPVPPGAGAAADAPIETLVYKKVRGGGASLFEMKKQLERECIVRALAETGGNITRAASLLGMKRPRLSQLVKEFDLGDASRDEGGRE